MADVIQDYEIRRHVTQTTTVVLEKLAGFRVRKVSDTDTLARRTAKRSFFSQRF